MALKKDRRWAVSDFLGLEKFRRFEKVSGVSAWGPIWAIDLIGVFSGVRRFSQGFIRLREKSRIRPRAGGFRRFDGRGFGRFWARFYPLSHPLRGCQLPQSGSQEARRSSQDGRCLHPGAIMPRSGERGRNYAVILRGPEKSGRYNPLWARFIAWGISVYGRRQKWRTSPLNVSRIDAGRCKRL